MGQVMRPLAQAVLAAMLATAVVGCSGRSGVAAPTARSSSTTDAASVSSPDRPADEPPGPGSMQAPASTSGALSLRSFPRPEQLGAGWAFAVDPGDVEEGYAGNGTPALARSPREVVQTAVPFGCPRTHAMPVPRHALEVDYTSPGGKVVTVRAAFAGSAAATRFHAARLANLRACSEVSGGPAIGPLVRRLQVLDQHTVVSDRTPQSDPWTEIATTDGSTVSLIALQGTANRPDAARARELAGAFAR